VSAEKAGKGRRALLKLTDVLLARQRKAPICRPFSDGETRTRTGDTTIFSRVLYQLSYLAAGRLG